jgi:hypothetical protein
MICVGSTGFELGHRNSPGMLNHSLHPCPAAYGRLCGLVVRVPGYQIF